MQMHNNVLNNHKWANDFFYACFSQFVPTVSELMQDESIHVQRLTLKFN
eukprot:UN01810